MLSFWSCAVTMSAKSNLWLDLQGVFEVLGHSY